MNFNVLVVRKIKKNQDGKQIKLILTTNYLLFSWQNFQNKTNTDLIQYLRCEKCFKKDEIFKYKGGIKTNCQLENTLTAEAW